MERDFAAYLFTLFCPLFTSGASFSIAHEYSLRKVYNYTIRLKFDCNFIALQLFDVLRHDRAAALRPK